jgi:hypothetical protein
MSALLIAMSGGILVAVKLLLRGVDPFFGVDAGPASTVGVGP